MSSGEPQPGETWFCYDEKNWVTVKVERLDYDRSSVYCILIETSLDDETLDFSKGFWFKRKWFHSRIMTPASR